MNVESKKDSIKGDIMLDDHFKNLDYFDGKTVIPFCTHGGGGFGKIENDIAEECSKSIILPGIVVNGTVTSEEVTNWLGTIGYELK